MKVLFIFVFTIFISFSSYSKALDIGSIALNLNAKQSVPVEYTEYVLSHAKIVPKVKAFAFRVANSKEKIMTFDKFLPLFVNKERIDEGYKFFQSHKNLLERVYKIYGINPCVVVAILSIETDLGKVKPNTNCLNALYSLALYSKRKKYFLYELKNYIVYTYRHKINPFSVKGSITCAIGIPQFMPSNINRYGVDFNENGLNLNEIPDAIASVANFLKKHGWKERKPIIRVLKKCAHEKGILVLKDSKGKVKCFKTYRNFWVLKSYNGTVNYALAAYELSKNICKLVNYK